MLYPLGGDFVLFLAKDLDASGNVNLRLDLYDFIMDSDER